MLLQKQGHFFCIVNELDVIYVVEGGWERIPFPQTVYRYAYERNITSHCFCQTYVF